MTRATEAVENPATRRVVYQALIERIRDRVPSLIPQGSRILVVSRGDDQLLRLEGVQAGHYPQADDGRYAGHYPADGNAAVIHLDALRARGAQFLLFPQPALWWLDHYEALNRHLQEQHRELHRDEDFALFELDNAGQPSDPPEVIDIARQAQWRQIESLLDAVLPREASVIAISRQDAMPGDLGGRTIHHIATSAPEGNAADAGGHPLSFALRDAIRAGARYLVVPHARDDPSLGPVLSTIRSRYRLILDHADLCSVFETIPARGATPKPVRGSLSATVRPSARNRQRGAHAEA